MNKNFEKLAAMATVRDHLTVLLNNRSVIKQDQYRTATKMRDDIDAAFMAELMGEQTRQEFAKANFQMENNGGALIMVPKDDEPKEITGIPVSKPVAAKPKSKAVKAQESTDPDLAAAMAKAKKNVSKTS